ncbi:MAG: hypothetical protein HQK51_02075 [Oligoflexia bacterium]|nr:hypothetical protein [Oligoflexia bacterium]
MKEKTLKELKLKKIWAISVIIAMLILTFFYRTFSTDVFAAAEEAKVVQSNDLYKCTTPIFFTKAELLSWNQPDAPTRLPAIVKQRNMMKNHYFVFEEINGKVERKQITLRADSPIRNLEFADENRRLTPGECKEISSLLGRSFGSSCDSRMFTTMTDRAIPGAIENGRLRLTDPLSKLMNDCGCTWDKLQEIWKEKCTIGKMSWRWSEKCHPITNAGVLSISVEADAIMALRNSETKTMELLTSRNLMSAEEGPLCEKKAQVEVLGEDMKKISFQLREEKKEQKHEEKKKEKEDVPASITDDESLMDALFLFANENNKGIDNRETLIDYVKTGEKYALAIEKGEDPFKQFSDKVREAKQIGEKKGKEAAKGAQQDAVAKLLWYMQARSGKSFTLDPVTMRPQRAFVRKGTFRINDKNERIFQVLSNMAKVYDRYSSHYKKEKLEQKDKFVYHEKGFDFRYGKIQIPGAAGLKTMLFGQLGEVSRDGKRSGENKKIFIKMEEHGADHWGDTFEHMGNYFNKDKAVGQTYREDEKKELPKTVQNAVKNVKDLLKQQIELLKDSKKPEDVKLKEVLTRFKKTGSEDENFGFAGAMAALETLSLSDGIKPTVKEDAHKVFRMIKSFRGVFCENAMGGAMAGAEEKKALTTEDFAATTKGCERDLGGLSEPPVEQKAPPAAVEAVAAPPSGAEREKK